MSVACRFGRHDLCKGEAWDLEYDHMTACACPCHVRSARVV